MKKMKIKKQKTKEKKRIAIIDLTDCEGCQVELLSLQEKLLEFYQNVEIVNWRLIQDKKEENYELALVEGSPFTSEEIEILKKIRQQSKILVAFGTCAALGGIPAILPKERRDYWYQKIYGKNYKPRGIDALPLSEVVLVDYVIPGCPINGEEALRIIIDLLHGRQPSLRNYPVCFECKIKGNPCRLLNNKPCLGPITCGGCQAICVSNGEMCWGCFGLREDANLVALEKILKNSSSEKEIQTYFSMFLSRVFKKNFPSS